MALAFRPVSPFLGNTGDDIEIIPVYEFHDDLILQLRRPCHKVIRQEFKNRSLPIVSITAYESNIIHPAPFLFGSVFNVIGASTPHGISAGVEFISHTTARVEKISQRIHQNTMQNKWHDFPLYVKLKNQFLVYERTCLSPKNTLSPKFSCAHRSPVCELSFQLFANSGKYRRRGCQQTSVSI